MAGQTGTRKHVFSKKIDAFLKELANAWNFVKRFFQEVFVPPYEFKEVIHQCYRIDWVYSWDSFYKPVSTFFV